MSDYYAHLVTDPSGWEFVGATLQDVIDTLNREADRVLTLRTLRRHGYTSRRIAWDQIAPHMTWCPKRAWSSVTRTFT